MDSFAAVFVVIYCVVFGSIITLSTLSLKEFWNQEEAESEVWIMFICLFLLWQCASIVWFKQGF